MYLLDSVIYRFILSLHIASVLILGYCIVMEKSCCLVIWFPPFRYILWRPL